MGHEHLSIQGMDGTIQIKLILTSITEIKFSKKWALDGLM